MTAGLAFQEGVLESFANSAKPEGATLEDNAFDTPKFDFEAYSNIQDSGEQVAGFIVSPIYSHAGLKTAANGSTEEISQLPVYGVTPISETTLNDIIDQDLIDHETIYFFAQKSTATAHAETQNYASECAYGEQKRTGMLQEIDSWTKEVGPSLTKDPESGFRIPAQSNDFSLKI